jgi:hypothetical protein
VGGNYKKTEKEGRKERKKEKKWIGKRNIYVNIVNKVN